MISKNTFKIQHLKLSNVGHAVYSDVNNKTTNKQTPQTNINNMAIQSKRKSLENAKRVYACPLMFVAPEDSQTRLRKKSVKNSASRTQQQKLRPKKDKELSLKQHERLHQLLSIYAEQSSHSFRTGASNVGSLPRLKTNYERKKTVIEHGRNNSSILPKLPLDNGNTPKKRRGSKNSEVHFPSITE